MLGCGVAALAAAALVLLGACFVAYIESGANTGRVTLLPYDAYEVGSIEYHPAEHFYLVRLSPSEFVALADLDAANRAEEGRRCRVAAGARTDPKLPELLERYGERMNPALAGSTYLLREECFGALYDASGLRLDADGRNLDRHPVTIDAQGRIVVDTRVRICSERTERELFAEVPCEGGR